MNHFQYRRQALRAGHAYYAARRRYLDVRLERPGAEREVQELFGAALAFELALRELLARRRGAHDGAWARWSMTRVRMLKHFLHDEYNEAASQPAQRTRA